MKKKNNSHQLRVTRFCNLIFAVLLVLSWAAPVNAGLFYSGTILAEEDNTGRFRQTSLHNLNLSLRQQVTNFMTVNEVLRYSYQVTEPLPGSERVSPSIDLVNDNPLIRFNLSVSSSMALEKSEKLADNGLYEMALRSKWDSDLVPDMQVVAHQRKNLKNVGLGGDRGEEKNSLSTTLDWDRGALSLYYNHGWAEDISAQGVRVQTIESHNGNLGFNKSYWGRKLRVRFSQEYTNNKRVREAVPTDLGLIPQIIPEVRTGIDNTPADPFEDPAVVISPGMRDGNLTVTAYGVASSSSDNNILLALSSPVEQIHLYTRTDLGPPPLLGLTWTLFTNDILGTAWDSVTLPPGAVVYNRVNVTKPYFEIKIAGGLSVNYLKLVLVTGPAIDFTEVLVFDSRIVTSSESIYQYTTNVTSLNLDGRLSPNWSVEYRADLSLRETEGRVFYEQEHLGYHVNLKYSSPDRTFLSKVSYGVSGNKDGRGGTIVESENVFYSADLDKNFLPTLSAGIGWDVREFSVSSVLISETFSYRFDSHARLYPDLDLHLGIDIMEREYYEDFSETSSITGNLTLTSRVKPGLVLILKESYAEQESERGSLSSKTYTSDISFQWRPADDLYFSGSVSYLDNDLPESNPFDLVLAMDLGITKSVLLAVDYSSTLKVQGKSQVGKILLNWYPKKGLRLESGCRYSQDSAGQSGKDILTFARMSVNFAMP